MKPFKALCVGAAAAVLLLAATDATAAKPKKGLVVDRVVAVVGDHVILHSELMRRVIPLTAGIRQITDPAERKRRRASLERQVLDEMVNETLIAQAAAESKIEITSDEIDNALKTVRQQNNLTDAQFAQALKAQGYDMASYRDDVSAQLLRMRAINVLVKPRVTVSDDEVRARYDEMSRRSGGVSQVHLRHILLALPPKPDDASLAKAKKLASEIVAKARAGGDFGKLAEQYSQDEQSRALGGDLGWIERGTIPTEWEVIVFAMAKGEVRGPLSGPRGLEIFYVEEVKRGDKKPFAEAKDKIRSDLFQRAMQRETDKWIDGLREDAYIDIKL
ncbi:MAG TPA: peptidylprolyl isomerase [Kofleriaceae bacterium]|nr:peptidylprolyl isomerase [Kofleriaceae bacterium]